MAKQYGFYFDADRRVQCRTCEVACRSMGSVGPTIKRRRVIDIWHDTYPTLTRTFFSLACMHCGKPACTEVCTTGAISKRIENGIVIVDRDKCNSCWDCFPSCPYSVPQFDDNGIMQMCDFCTGADMEPPCAESCPTEALNSGTLDELQQMAKGKAARRMDGPTEPSIIM